MTPKLRHSTIVFPVELSGKLFEVATAIDCHFVYKFHIADCQ